MVSPSMTPMAGPINSVATAQPGLEETTKERNDKRSSGANISTAFPIKVYQESSLGRPAVLSHARLMIQKTLQAPVSRQASLS